MDGAKIYQFTRPRQPTAPRGESSDFGSAFDTAMNYALLAGAFAIQAAILLGLCGFLPVTH